jgi:hypothetical protein
MENFSQIHQIGESQVKQRALQGNPTILGIAGGNNVWRSLRQEDVPSQMLFFTFLFAPFLMLSTQ